MRPAIVADRGFGDCEGIVAAAQSGNAVECADEMSQQSSHIHTVTWRGIGELLRRHAGNDDLTDGQGAVENGPGVLEVMLGGTSYCVHVGIVPTKTGHLMAGLMGKCDACGLTG